MHAAHAGGTHATAPQAAVAKPAEAVQTGPAAAVTHAKNAAGPLVFLPFNAVVPLEMV